MLSHILSACVNTVIQYLMVSVFVLSSILCYQCLCCLVFTVLVFDPVCYTFFQADIKPQTDGANGLKYNLTADIIESIFKTYPMGEF